MTSAPVLKNFIDRQRMLLERERKSEAERTSLLLSNCSHKLLEQKGLALGGLGVVSVQIGLGGKSLIELERPTAYHPSIVFPPHTFRTGDLARVEEHASSISKSGKKAVPKVNIGMQEDQRALEGVVYKVSDTRIVIAIDPSPSNEDHDIPERCRLLKLANTVTYDRMDKAMDLLERLVLPDTIDPKAAQAVQRHFSGGPYALHRVLLGMTTPTNPPPASHVTPNIFFDQLLNASQVSAVRFALHAPEVACIHGPPGTGKTRVLVEVIRQLVFAPLLEPFNSHTDKTGRHGVNKPVKILVCGASNLAVDNLLERLSSPTPVPGPASILVSSESTDTMKNNLGPIPQQPFPPIKVTRLGHPARVLSSLHSRTLDAQAQASDEAALVQDVKDELEELMSALTGRGSRIGVKASSKGGRAAQGLSANPRDRSSAPGRFSAKKAQKLRGEERKKAWETVRELRKEYRKREGGVTNSVIAKTQVVLATCHGAGSRQLYDSEFDVVIIDEATQALEAVCWIPVLKGHKLILAGDPLQLGPTIISEGNRRHAKSKDRISVDKASEKSESSNTRSVTAQKQPAAATSSQAKPRNEPIDSDDGTMPDSDASLSSSVGDRDINAGSRPSEPHVPKQTGDLPRPLLRPPKSLGTTIFERLEAMYNGKIKLMLDIQYRMNSKISAFPTRTLYHSRLNSHPSNASRLLRDLPGVSQNAEYEDVVGEGSEVVFWDTSGAEFWERSGDDGEAAAARAALDDGGSLCNENEAEVVKRWVDRLIEAGVKASDIAIITPYQAQSQVLSTLLADPELEIGTADGMQGREREAVVISLVRSNPNGEVGFLKDKRRLNVAMTRAKRQLCVIGDSSTIRRGGGSYLSKWMDWLEAEADVRFAGAEQ